MTTTKPVGKSFSIPTYPARPATGGAYRGIGQLPYNPEKYSFSGKYNGWRMLIHLPTRSAFNRHGEPLSIAGEFDQALNILCPTLDCEAFKWADVEGLERRHGIGKGTLVLLDVIPEAGCEAMDVCRECRGLCGKADESVSMFTPCQYCGGNGSQMRKATDATHEQRCNWVPPSIIPVHQLDQKPEENTVYQVQRFSAGELAHNWQLMQDINAKWGCQFYEGVVAVRRDSVYPIQLRSPDEKAGTWIKMRWNW